MEVIIAVRRLLLLMLSVSVFHGLDSASATLFSIKSSQHDVADLFNNPFPQTPFTRANTICMRLLGDVKHIAGERDRVATERAMPAVLDGCLALFSVCYCYHTSFLSEDLSILLDHVQLLERYYLPLLDDAASSTATFGALLLSKTVLFLQTTLTGRCSASIPG